MWLNEYSLMRKPWIKYLFEADYDDFSAKVYLRKHNLPISDQSISERVTERRVLWDALSVEEKGNKSARALKRAEVVEVSFEDVENTFDSGQEHFVLTIMECYNYDVAFQQRLVDNRDAHLNHIMMVDEKKGRHLCGSSLLYRSTFSNRYKT